VKGVRDMFQVIEHLPRGPDFKLQYYKIKTKANIQKKKKTHKYSMLKA
jgi:hypothetical protein